jgi:hypothetical protein
MAVLCLQLTHSWPLIAIPLIGWEEQGMAVDVKKISGAILELERSLNERWSAGDCHGYLDNYHDDISYFDPVVERILVGRESVVEHLLKLYKNPQIVRSEYLNLIAD